MPLSDKEKFALAHEWRTDAVRDGWKCEKMYHNQPETVAAQLTREGFIAQVYCSTRKEKYSGRVVVWGPDGCAVRSKLKYSWNELKASMRKCEFCAAVDVDTKRVGFAGRCCAVCYPTVQPRVEFRGWAD